MGLLDDMEANAREEGKAEACESIAQKLIAAGKLALEEIASVCGLTLQHVQELAQART